MDYNTVVRRGLPDFGRTQKFVLFLVVIAIYALAALLQDKTAAVERRNQMVISIQQAFSETLDAAAGCLATGLNMLLQHVTLFLQDAGIRVSLPIDTVTPEGIIFVAQWVLLLLICYGVIAGAFFLLTLFVRGLWWLLKVTLALACFGLILKDHTVGIETVTLRLACLGCVCMLLSIRAWRDRRMAARIVHLEEQVKKFEKQEKELQRLRSRCALLLCCLIGILCLVGFIVFRFLVFILNLN